MEGEVIACPTEAVWGLSCDPCNQQAVEYLLALKDRPVSKGLILVAHDMGQLQFLLKDLSRQQLDTLSATWPGPATWLVPHGGRVPNWICGDHDTVALRVSDHPVVSALCAAWGGPLVSTSANPAGALPARYAFQVRRYFGDSLGDVMPGATGSAGKPTTIRHLKSGQIIRH
jgi:L-threonylcarbamoyladenylate synthase